MGILRNGVFGPLRGKAGNLVGRVSGQRNLISMVRHPGLLPLSEVTVEQNVAFRVVTMLMRQLMPLIKVGFAYNKKIGAFPAAVKYNYKRILEKGGNEYNLRYDQLVISRGGQAGPNSPGVQAFAGGLLVFNWFATEQMEYSRADDACSFLVYNVAKKMPVVVVAGARRRDLSFTMDLPADFAGDELHVFMTIQSGDDRRVSDSVYLGSLTGMI